MPKESLFGGLNAVIARYSDLILAALVISVLGMIIIPLPPWLLDFLITSDLAIGVVILLAALYISDALKIASLSRWLHFGLIRINFLKPKFWSNYV